MSASLKSAVTGSAMPAKLSDMKPREQVAYLLDQKKGEIAKMLPQHLNAERLLKVAQIAVTTTPGLLKCDVASLIGAIGQCAQMGLEPNTVLGHAYLVPFKTKRKDADRQRALGGFRPGDHRLQGPDRPRAPVRADREHRRP